MNLVTQYLTQNDCYRAGRTIQVKGVMVHSTGANNPRVSRYVPGDAEIGYNTGGNHWNQTNAEWKAKYGTVLNKCVHAFIGKFADGAVGTVQTLPWTMRGWHCAGTGNNTHIGFEICEDGLTDPDYFQAVYQEAVELTAYLCQQYGLDPLADGVVICHQEGYQRGIASNHADVLHWFPKHGKTMDDFRADVAWAMKGEDDMSEEQIKKIAKEVCLQLMELEENTSYERWLEYMEQYRKEQGQLPVPEWARTELELARAAGITDGKRPLDLATREEVAIMSLRALRSMKKQ